MEKRSDLCGVECDPEARKRGISNVFVKNLDDSIDGTKLHTIFANCGLVLSCKVAVSEDGKSKHYGFVQFDSDASAQNAIQKVNGYKVNGKALPLISKDSNGVSKGFGFVNFENPDNAKQAKESMNGVQLGSTVLYVSRTQNKSERQQEQTKRTKVVNLCK
ncbi:RNA recognition motif domain [Dillenia turbinata]|uniref:RNA recognition motif domain n=1 Tax=Dillenia turbinata TaxID=194707 RepID=A0AAN8ZD27_9MAGN